MFEPATTTDNIIDTILVNGTANAVGKLAGVMRQIQTGYLYTYAFAMIIGLIGLWGRRFLVDRVRYISGPSDHLMLALLLEDVHVIHGHGAVSVAHTASDIVFFDEACRKVARRLRQAM